jgi:hypothetical protein
MAMKKSKMAPKQMMRGKKKSKMMSSGKRPLSEAPMIKCQSERRERQLPPLPQRRKKWRLEENLTPRVTRKVEHLIQK